MIHRGISRRKRIIPPVIAYQVYSGSLAGVDAFWMSGGLSIPVRIHKTVEGHGDVILRDCRLSPDGTELLWFWHNNDTALDLKDRVYAGTIADDGGSPDLLAENPSDASPVIESWAGTWGEWHPDGSQIFYRGENNRTQRHGEIRVVNRDGTGNTLLYSRTGLGSNNNLWSFDMDDAVMVNRDGTLLGFWDQNSIGTGAYRGLWILNADGTGATRRWASTGFVSNSGIRGFAHLSDDVAFTNDTGGSPNVFTIRKINAISGSSVVLYTGVLFNIPERAWTPNDDYLIGKHLNVHASDPRDEIALLATDGSGTIIDLGVRTSQFERRMNHGPALGRDGRVYFSQISGLSGITEGVWSCELDGSDVRLDHDLSGAAQFYGFYSSN